MQHLKLSEQEIRSIAEKRFMKPYQGAIVVYLIPSILWGIVFIAQKPLSEQTWVNHWPLLVVGFVPLLALFVYTVNLQIKANKAADIFVIIHNDCIDEELVPSSDIYSMLEEYTSEINSKKDGTTEKDNG